MHQRDGFGFERAGTLHRHGSCGQLGRSDVRFAGRNGRPTESFGEIFASFGTDSNGLGPGFRRGLDRRYRMFDAGELRLVILKLLSEQPSYGYQLIKDLEKLLAGGYTPSAGVIYPTLNILEEEGFATSSQSESSKKVYSLTVEGLKYLEVNRERIGELFIRIEAVGERFKRCHSPELVKAFINLRDAMLERMGRNVTPEKIRKLVDAINAAAKAIDEL